MFNSELESGQSVTIQGDSFTRLFSYTSITDENS